MRPMELRDLTLTNRHGKRMPATYRIVENAKGTFVLLHGIGGWKDQRVMRALIDPVVESGYSVVTFDAADGANAPDANSLTGTPTGYLEDLEDVIARIREESWYKAPLSLGGHSLGALMAVRYAAEHSDEVAKLVLAAPGLSWKTYQHLVPVGLWWTLRGKVRMPGPELRHYWIGKPWLFDFLTFDGLKYANNVRAKTLVVMGAKDGLVGTLRTHRKYAAAFQNATFKAIKGASHTFHPHEETLTATIKEWLTSS